MQQQPPRAHRGAVHPHANAGRRVRPRLEEGLRNLVTDRGACGFGICTSCQNTAPLGLVPVPVPLWGFQQSELQCWFCWQTRRIHLLCQRLDHGHQSRQLIRNLLSVIFQHLVEVLGPAPDNDEDLAEFTTTLPVSTADWGSSAGDGL